MPDCSVYSVIGVFRAQLKHEFECQRRGKAEKIHLHCIRTLNVQNMTAYVFLISYVSSPWIEPNSGLDPACHRKARAVCNYGREEWKLRGTRTVFQPPVHTTVRDGAPLPQSEMCSLGRPFLLSGYAAVGGQGPREGEKGEEKQTKEA